MKQKKIENQAQDRYGAWCEYLEKVNELMKRFLNPAMYAYLIFTFLRWCSFYCSILSFARNKAQQKFANYLSLFRLRDVEEVYFIY